MTNESKPTCETCDHWVVSDGEAYGNCRRFPQVVGTDRGDNCGEHSDLALKQVSNSDKDRLTNELDVALNMINKLKSKNDELRKRLSKMEGGARWLAQQVEEG